MSERLYQRGSEWRRWDLQVHTPFSALNSGFGDDFDAYAKTLFEKAIQREIAVIGVTDYFLIDGYKQLKALQQDSAALRHLIGEESASKAGQILLLPNIELRISVVVNNNRVNFHIIFSDAVSPETIEEHFLRDLKFTSASSAGSPDEALTLTRPNLESLGRRLKQQHENFRDQADLFVGMKNVVIAHEEVTAVLERQPARFKGKYLIVVPADEDLSACSWDNQAHLTRKLLIQKAHMLFSSNPGTREFGLGLKHKMPEDFKREFGGLKPCIHGSDAHSYASLFQPASGKELWVKANPTFQGLKQLLHEPAARVYIGPRPSSLVHVEQNATKYMSKLCFERTERAKPGVVWFSGDVPMNHGLIAIIGKKGSGKSALADILGLLGETRVSEHFLFLDRAHFLQPKAMLGGMFRASVKWRSGRSVSRTLDESIDGDSPELVKYIPQKYLENICSDLKRLRESGFYRELMDVIFSHVSDADRLGKEALPELIDFLTSEKEGRISQLVLELRDLNEAIVALEDQLTSEHRRGLEARLKEREAELKAHDEARPAEVPEPTQDAQQRAAVESMQQELAALVEQTQALDTGIANARAELKMVALGVAAADRLGARIDNLEKQFDTFHADSVDDADVLSLDTRVLVTLAADRQPITHARKRAEERRQSIEELLDPDDLASLSAQRRELSEKASSARSKLDEPNRRYQEYLHQLAEWHTRRTEIEGSSADADSLKGLKEKLSILEHLPSELLDKMEKRFGLVREIFQTKERLLEDYRRLYASVQEFICDHPISKKHGALEFTASIGIEGLEDELLGMIHQRKRGSFQGDADGRDRLRELVERSDFLTEAGVRAFLEEIQKALEVDGRTEERNPIWLRRQLRQGKTPEDVYDFLYGLDYLKPRFELRWQGKPLDLLSPGERGSLLLVFYLLIDKRSVPLIIDQPEENLDNQTVTTMVVPAINDAKERRQIIIVTHNPNLAVVCDADQVIHAGLDKTDGNRVTYTSGAIEDPHITQLIVDVLEGTKPAFDLRDDKYDILEGSS